MADGPVQVAQPVAIGALVSGAGRSIANLQECIARGELAARVAVVIATREDVPALARCRAMGLRTAVVPVAPEGAARAASGEGAAGAAGAAATFDDRLDDALREHGVELVCLCGYLRKFRVAAWRGRAINMHPALLPQFGGEGMFGLHVHRAVLAAGCATSGCTAHWVDDQYDHGEPIVQARCPVLPTDTPETLAERVFQLECTAYPQAITHAARAIRAESSGGSGASMRSSTL